MKYKDIFNKASYAAIQSNKNGVNKNQINQLLSILNTNMGLKVEYIIMMLIAFVMRQNSRRLIKNESAEAIKTTLEKILNEKLTQIKNDDDLQKIKKKNLREYLGLLKWFFEVANSKQIRVNWNVTQDNAFDSITRDFSKSVSRRGR
ncbi:MAG: hypothetical protein V3V33_13170 [Candidatus Lokiarchaeia archaeon]